MERRAIGSKSRPNGANSELLELVQRSLDDDKAEDLVVIDLANKSSIADHMVIASGRSARQVSAMADHLAERIKAAGFGSAKVEGRANADWVLIDAGDVIDTTPLDTRSSVSRQRSSSAATAVAALRPAKEIRRNNAASRLMSVTRSPDRGRSCARMPS